MHLPVWLMSAGRSTLLRINTKSILDVTIFYYKIFISKHFPSTITNIYQQTPSAVALSYVYMSKSWCIESDANKVSLMLKTEMADSYFVILEKFEGYLKIKLMLKAISC